MALEAAGNIGVAPCEPFELTVFLAISEDPG